MTGAVRPSGPSAPDERARLWSRWLAWGILIFILANLVLGWGGGVDALTRGKTGLAAMVPQTSLCFGLLALSQIAGLGRRGRPLPATGLALLSLSLAWSQLFLMSPAFPEDLPSDRMSVATVALITLLGAAQLFSGAGKWPGGRWALSLCALLALGVSMGGIAAFMFDVQELERYRLFRGLSILTSLTACTLAVSVLLSQPALRAVGILFARTPGGALARTFLPPAILVPVILAVVGDQVVDIGIIGAQARLAVTTVTVIALAVSFLLSVAVHQDMLVEREQQHMKVLETVLSGLEAGVVVLDRPGQPVLSNRSFEKLIGDTPIEEWLSGGGFRSLETGMELRGGDHPVDLALSSDGHHMAYWRTPQGTDLVLQFSAFDAGTGPEGRARQVLVVQDMTEAWHLRASMAQTERLNAVGQLAGGVAHEVTNIFGVIKLAVGTAELIAPSGAPEQYGAILNACRRGGSLAERLQRLSVSTTGAERVVNGSAAVEAACDLAERGLPPSVRMIRDLPGTADLIVCDPMELELAVLNLVLNARNAILENGQDDGEIVVRLRIDDADFRLSVSDNGPGIPADILSHVREPFFTTRGAAGGTGFGLALIDTFVSRSGGRFHLLSGPKGGTEAVIALPVVRYTLAQEEDSRPGPTDLTGIRILVVEGDSALKGMLHESLSALNAKVEQSESPQSALSDLQRKGHFDVLISAVGFSGPLSGRDLAQQAVARQPGLGVVFVTADRDAEQSGDALPGPVLHKPVHLGVLSRAVAEVAGRLAKS